MIWLWGIALGALWKGSSCARFSWQWLPLTQYMLTATCLSVIFWFNFYCRWAVKEWMHACRAQVLRFSLQAIEIHTFHFVLLVMNCYVNTFQRNPVHAGEESSSDLNFCNTSNLLVGPALTVLGLEGDRLSAFETLVGWSRWPRFDSCCTSNTHRIKTVLWYK